MDFVKTEDRVLLDEENYKTYMENLQKSHQIESMDYQYNVTMEQIQLAMQSSLNPNLMHNFQLPLSPRQMSTLMLKTNHLSRTLNFNEIPAHLQKSDLELMNEIRHDDLLNQNLNRNLEMARNDLAQNINRNLELRADLAQNRSLELARNDLVQINRNDLAQNLNRNLELVQNLNRNMDLVRNDIEMQANLHIDTQRMDMQNPNIDMMNRIDNDLANSQEERRSPLYDSHLLKQHLDRFDYSMNQKIDQILAQRMELGQRLDQRIGNGIEHRVEQNDLPIPFYIKPEQEEDLGFYDNMSQGLANTVNGEIPQQELQSPTIHQDHIFSVYNNHLPIQALNSLEIYQRQQNYTQNYVNEVARDNPQNLVIHRQFDNPTFNDEIKKLRQDGGKFEMSKHEDPKENLKPDENKIFYYEKNENDSSVNNKIDDLSMNIKGQYSCFKCKEVFPSKRILKQHAKNCENGLSVEELDKLGKFSCSQCAYRCQSPAILKIHERTHSGEKPYACTFCDYKSGQKNNVAKHILVHMKQKPFRCQFCEYRCAQKNNLVVHERTHTGYKPFACPFCEYRTVQKPNLVKHMYLHTDQKPFSCDMCSYRCVQKTNLTKHKQRHLNEKEGEKVDFKVQSKPYRPRQKSVKCPHCPYKCVQKSSLEKHLHFKHSEEGRSDFSVGQSEFSAAQSEFNASPNDFSADKSDFSATQNDFSADQNDYSADKGDFSGNEELCDTIQNLSVKKDTQFDCVDKIVESLPIQA
ncbi:unnamed protein product [Pieris macdunnoughi]|uniref:C2H2-type domain-containing protein n=1 Tax=Pieris macdunnoughi TaxID=345717 RepID=A0A821Y5D0_9NEOP|nr:unnamed protein product [Pieris macdunnoughi]